MMRGALRTDVPAQPLQEQARLLGIQVTERGAREEGDAAAVVQHPRR